jgi:hypothetical protein
VLQSIQISLRPLSAPYRPFIVDVTACFDISEDSGVGCQVSDLSNASGLKSGQSNRKRNFDLVLS